MLTFADDLDGMPIEDALDFLDVYISEERGLQIIVGQAILT